MGESEGHPSLLQTMGVKETFGKKEKPHKERRKESGDRMHAVVSFDVTVSEHD